MLKIANKINIILVVCLLIVIIVFYKTIKEVDVSTKCIYRKSSSLFDPSVYLVSYADGPEVFFKNRNFLAFTAINSGVDFTYNYRRFHIDREFIKNNPILNEPFGAGFWVWKPYLILKTLDNIPENSILIYADSGMSIRKPIREYLENCFVDSTKDVVLFSYDKNTSIVPFTGNIAAGRVFDVLKCRNDSCRYGHHIWAGFIAVKNSTKSREFIKNWLNYCCNVELITGINQGNNYPEFKQVQHDESILSVLAHRDHAVVNLIDMDPEFFKHFYIHRRKMNKESKSLLGFNVKKYLPEIKDKIIKYLRKINNIQIRSYIAKILFTNSEFNEYGSN